MEEIWKPVPAAESHEVSNTGRIRSRKGRNGSSLPEGEWRICDLTQCRKGKNAGYLKIGIGGKTWWVHRLVAAVHLPPPPDPKFVVDHIDRYRWHNSVDNLQWISRTENNRKTVLQGQGNTQNLRREDVEVIKRRLTQGESGHSIKQDFPQASTGMISDINTGRTWGYLN